MTGCIALYSSRNLFTISSYLVGILRKSLLLLGERVQLGLRIVDDAGRYLVHCHNLEHENAGMMRNFLIR